MGNILSLKDEVLENAKKYVHQVARENGKSLKFFGLDLKDKGLKKLIVYINKEIPDLKEFTLEDSFKITKIPKELGSLQELTKLKISNNKVLSSIPNEIENLKHLTSIELSHNILTGLPDGIGKLSNLKSLNLTANKLVALPDNFTALVHLKEINLHLNRLNSLPNMSSFGELIALNVKNNQINSLPDSIGDLSNLKNLDISGNQITAIPESIGKLSNLQHLKLSFNRLTSLPENIRQLESLEVIERAGNPLDQHTLSWIQDLSTSAVVTNNLVIRALTVDQALTVLYPTEEERNQIKNGLTSLYTSDKRYKDAKNNELSTEKVISNFIEFSPLSTEENPSELQEIYRKNVKEILNKVLDNTEGRSEIELQTITTSLGHCATPVTSLLIQNHIGIHAKNGKMDSFLECLLEREALEKSLIKKFSSQEANTTEFIEKISGLVNFIYAPVATKDQVKNIRKNYSSPFLQEEPRTPLESKSISLEFAYNMVRDDQNAILALANICCKKDNNDILIKSDDNKYIVDPVKLMVLREEHCQSLAIETDISRNINNFESEFKNYLENDPKAKELSVTYYDRSDVLRVIDTQALKNNLRTTLFNEAVENYDNVTHAFIEQSKSNIAATLTSIKQQNSNKNPKRRSRSPRGRGV
ncbi:leucine-rich repeat domain-containing protein [Aquimarina sp. W85]|uniref:leucine-rich repeat domain-containing protein n=1 Tax=Aquimarina rhodophyticola TaxID=3342246 RepID=UPI0036730F0D